MERVEKPTFTELGWSGNYASESPIKDFPVNHNWRCSLFKQMAFTSSKQEREVRIDHKQWIGGLILVLALAGSSAAQPQASRPAAGAPSAKATATPPSEEDISATREQLFQLLKLSPRLTTVVIRDPSLLSDQEYVSHNNPELAQFLESHSEIARNPDFYLFANVSGPNRERRLEREIWPGMGGGEPSRMDTRDIWVFLVFVCILSSVIWLLRMVIENRRWSRVFRVQTEIYNKLLDKFTSNEELVNYIRTESGKHFLESASIPFGYDLQKRPASPLSRVLLPLQFGVVISLVGLGFLYLRNTFKDEPSLLILGVLTLMLGIGFIISAGFSWMVARHSGLFSQGAEFEHGSTNASDRV